MLDAALRVDRVAGYRVRQHNAVQVDEFEGKRQICIANLVEALGVQHFQPGIPQSSLAGNMQVFQGPRQVEIAGNVPGDV